MFLRAQGYIGIDHLFVHQSVHISGKRISSITDETIRIKLSQLQYSTLDVGEGRLSQSELFQGR